MNARLKNIASVLLGITFFLTMFILLYFGIRGIWQTLLGVNPQLAVAVVAGGTTLIVSTVTIMLGRYFERKKEVEAHFRADKIKIYDEFLSELFKIFHGKSEITEEDMTIFLREWQRKLILWGGSNVLSSYFKWMQRLQAGFNDAHTVFLMDDFFRALRVDIGQNSNGLEKGAFANLIMRHASLFLHEAKKNPDITLNELAELEKELYGEEV